MIFRDKKFDLKCEIGRIIKPEINVIVENARAAAERQSAVFVREWIETVMMTFGDAQRRVQRHPIKQIRQLTQTAADSAHDFALRKLHSFDVTFRGGRFAEPLPKRKSLARFN